MIESGRVTLAEKKDTVVERLFSKTKSRTMIATTTMRVM
jgi:hypothetical protein